MNRLLCFAALVDLVLFSSLAGQTVVVDDNIEFVPDSFGIANYLGTIFQDLSGDYTSTWFDYNAGNLTAIGSNLDEGSDWYLVLPGDAFGFASLERGEFTPISTMGNSHGPVFVGQGDFFLGVSTGLGWPDANPARNVFGWVRLRNVSGQLAMVNNAVAYDSLGIIVGTTDVVPEPSSIGLGWMVLATLGLCRRNRDLLS